MLAGDIRLAAHHSLTDAAHALRAARPGMTMADAFELVSFRNPETARLLDLDPDSMAARRRQTDLDDDSTAPGGPTPADALGTRFRDHVRTQAGKVDRACLEAFAVANGCWLRRYAGLSVPSLTAAVLFRLRRRVARGYRPVWR